MIPRPSGVAEAAGTTVPAGPAVNASVMTAIVAGDGAGLPSPSAGTCATAHRMGNDSAARMITSPPEKLDPQIPMRSASTVGCDPSQAIASRYPSSWILGIGHWRGSPSLAPNPKWSYTSVVHPSAANAAAYSARNISRTALRPCAITIPGRGSGPNPGYSQPRKVAPRERNSTSRRIDTVIGSA